jgi:hypothetical protein
MTMTKRSSPKNQDMGVLKTLLVLGSVAATLAGTRLVAVKDTVAQASATTAVPEPKQIIIIEPAPITPLPMPPTNGGSGQAIVLDLAPIPQAVTPHINPVQVQQVQQVQQTQPVAKTKSS